MTEERLIEILNEDTDFSTDRDSVFEAIKLLRERIPLSATREIIQSAEHDKIWLPDVSVAAKFLSEEDAAMLRDFLVGVEDDEYLYLFV